MAWSIREALGALAVLAIGVLVGCTGDKFHSCEATRSCPHEPGDGGAAGALADDGGSFGSGGTRSAPASSSGGSSSSDANSGSGGGSTGATASGQGGTSAEAGGAAGAPASCVDTCELTCCGEVCADLESDPDHCGACSTACTPDHGVGACLEGVCALGACDEDRVDCNGDYSDGCEVEAVSVPAIPFPRRPMLGAFTGSLFAAWMTLPLRPTFEWFGVEAETCEAVTYELQVDDSCSVTGFQGCEFPSPEVDVKGLETTTYMPPEDLPVERVQLPLGTRYFWHVRACESRDHCSEWSDIFYVNVGRAKQDVTGDGYPDLVGLSNSDVDAFTTDQMFIIKGKPEFGEDHGASELVALAEPFDAELVAAHLPPAAVDALMLLGDVNGDGFNDVGVKGVYVDGVGIRFDIWLGGENFGAEPPLAIIAPGISADFPALWPAGDFDRDGMADVLLALNGNPGGPSSEPWVTLKSGGAKLAEPVLAEDLVRQSEPTDPYQFVSGATAGDFNGDGLPDLVLSVGPLGGEFNLIKGGGAGDLEPERVATLADPCRPMPSSLDFDADGYDDVPLLCASPDGVKVMFGVSGFFYAGVINKTSVIYYWGAGLKNAQTDVAVGDLDTNGYDDLALSDGTVFAGGAPAATDPAYEGDPTRADQAVAIGDHDADGRPDLAFGGFWFASRDGFLIPHPIETATGPLSVVAWAK